MILQNSNLLKDHEIDVILVDRTDQQIGVEGKVRAHELGRLHRAFSVIIYNSKGEMLIQRRAFSKYHSPGLWSNTCCGHPLPTEPAQNAAERRLWEELGFTCKLKFRAFILYHLKLDYGMFEHEYVHIFEATSSSDPVFKLNQEEVEEIKWITPQKALEEVKTNPFHYTRWFRLYLLKYFVKVFKQELT